MNYQNTLNQYRNSNYRPLATSTTTSYHTRNESKTEVTIDTYSYNTTPRNLSRDYKVKDTLNNSYTSNYYKSDKCTYTTVQDRPLSTLRSEKRQYQPIIGNNNNRNSYSSSYYQKDTYYGRSPSQIKLPIIDPQEMEKSCPICVSQSKTGTHAESKIDNNNYLKKYGKQSTFNSINFHHDDQVSTSGEDNHSMNSSRQRSNSIRTVDLTKSRINILGYSNPNSRNTFMNSSQYSAQQNSQLSSRRSSVYTSSSQAEQELNKIRQSFNQDRIRQQQQESQNWFKLQDDLTNQSGMQSLRSTMYKSQQNQDLYRSSYMPQSELKKRYENSLNKLEIPQQQKTMHGDTYYWNKKIINKYQDEDGNTVVVDTDYKVQNDGKMQTLVKKETFNNKNQIIKSQHYVDGQLTKQVLHSYESGDQVKYELPLEKEESVVQELSEAESILKSSRVQNYQMFKDGKAKSEPFLHQNFSDLKLNKDAVLIEDENSGESQVIL